MTGWIPPREYAAKLPKATVFAHFLFTTADDRILQLHTAQPEHPEHWQWPGGNLDDPTQSPWDTAVRECTEETGIDMSDQPTRLLGMHVVAHRPHWPYHHIGFIFDGGHLTDSQVDAIRLDPAEHDYFETRSLTGWAPDIGADRLDEIAALLGARTSGIPCYLEISR